jgi:peroxiredoxin
LLLTAKEVTFSRDIWPRAAWWRLRVSTGGFRHQNTPEKGEVVMAASPSDIVFDLPAPDFNLPGVDGRTYRFADVAGEKGAVIVFICNHCPYVLAVIDRLATDARVLMVEGIGFAAICSNDAAAYPDDSFPKMQLFAKQHNLPFPYLHDETQDVARAYGAVCTPDFFGYGAGGKLKYRGRLDEGRTSPPPPGARRELFEAMRAVAADDKIPQNQMPSIGCSIKWKPGGA